MKNMKELNHKFLTAVGFGNQRAAKYCLRKGVSIHHALEANQPSIWMNIVESENPVLNNLAKAGGALLMDCAPGVTALHIAVFSGDAKMTRWLLDRGADPMRKSTNGVENAFELAKGRPSLEVRSMIQNHLLKKALPATFPQRRVRL